MKKWMIFLDMIFIFAILGLAISYFIVNNNAREDYISKYNLCIENNIVLESYGEPAQSCVSSGGCFSPCANYCDTEKPYVGFFEMFSPKEDDCGNTCIQRCYYPVDKFKEAEYVEKPKTIIDNLCLDDFAGCRVSKMMTCEYNGGIIYKTEYNCFNSKDKYFDFNGNLISDQCGGIVVGSNEPAICAQLGAKCKTDNVCK